MRPLGRAVIGGLLVATIFTLFSCRASTPFCMIWRSVPGRSNSDAEASLHALESHFGIVPVALYLSYRIYESNVDATTLRKHTLEDTIPTVAITYPKPVPLTETITLPGISQAGSKRRSGTRRSRLPRCGTRTTAPWCKRATSSLKSTRLP